MRLALLLLVAPSLAAADTPKSPIQCTLAECEKQCSPSNGAACTRAAEMYFDGKLGAPVDRAKSFALAKRGCDAGDTFGCAMVGYHYQDGVGVAWSPAQAAATYQKACAAGAGVACFNLATMYSGAHGVDLDRAKAAEYQRLAKAKWTAQCSSGDTRWCTNLGYVVANEGDVPAAGKLNAKACAGGDLVGCVEAVRVGFETKTLDTKAGLAELDRVCKAGEGGACSLAGVTYILGEHVAKDVAGGIALLRRGCDAGDRQACQLVAHTYADGQLVAKDAALAERYLVAACDRSMPGACVELSRLRYAAKQSKDALALATRACHMGDPMGCSLAAAQHFLGDGTPKSERDGVELSTHACRMGDKTSCGWLMDRNVPLPVPPDVAKKLYAEACAAGIKSGCAHK